MPNVKLKLIGFREPVQDNLKKLINDINSASNITLNEYITLKNALEVLLAQMEIYSYQDFNALCASLGLNTKVSRKDNTEEKDSIVLKVNSCCLAINYPPENDKDTDDTKIFKKLLWQELLTEIFRKACQGRELKATRQAEVLLSQLQTAIIIKEIAEANTFADQLANTVSAIFGGYWSIGKNNQISGKTIYEAGVYVLDENQLLKLIGGTAKVKRNSKYSEPKPPAGDKKFCIASFKLGETELSTNLGALGHVFKDDQDQILGFMGHRPDVPELKAQHETDIEGGLAAEDCCDFFFWRLDQDHYFMAFGPHLLIEANQLETLINRIKILHHTYQSFQEKRRKIEQFLSNINAAIAALRIDTHDITNLLNQISSLLQLITLEDDETERQKLLDCLLGQDDESFLIYGNYMPNMREHLLQTIALIRANQAALIETLNGLVGKTSQPCQIKDALFLNKNFLGTIAYLAKDKHMSNGKINIKVLEYINGENIKVNYPKREMEQLLRDLVINAIKYRKNDTVEVTIEVHYWIVNDKIIVSFKDHGRGIKPDELSKIFESEFRGTNTGDVNGTGIGLSLLSLLMERIWVGASQPEELKELLPEGAIAFTNFSDHGTYAAASEENQGTQILFVLPTISEDKS